MSVDPAFLTLTRGEVTAEEKSETQGLLTVLLEELNEELQDEWADELGKVKCANKLCRVRLRKVGYDSFIYCKNCKPLRYYCSDCKALGRADHAHIVHDVCFRRVSEDEPALNAQSSTLMARGLALGRVIARRAELFHPKLSADKASCASAGLRLILSRESGKLVFSLASKIAPTLSVVLGKKGATIFSTAVRCGRSSMSLIWSGPIKKMLERRAGTIVPLCRFGFDLYDALKKLYRGEIALDDFKDLMKDSGLRNTGLFLGSYAGKQAGAYFGGIFFGPVGAMFGMWAGAFAGGFLGESFGHYLAGDKDKELKNKALMEAAEHFQFPFDKLEDNAIFNYKELKRRYKSRALELHPDRPTGDTVKFQTMGFYYGILVDYWKKREGIDVIAEAAARPVRRLAIPLPAAE